MDTHHLNTEQPTAFLGSAIYGGGVYPSPCKGYIYKRGETSNQTVWVEVKD